MTEKLYEARSSRETVLETGLFAIFLLAVTASPFTIIGAMQGPDAALGAVGDAGGVLLEHIGWALSGYIAVLLGFYLVVIGGQILGGGDEAARIRQLLGAVAELVGAAAIVLVVMVGAHCVGEPRSWAVFIAIGPMVVLVVFLAVALGRFLIPGREMRLEDAERRRKSSRLRSRKFSVRTRRQFMPVWATNAIIASMPGTTVFAVWGGVAVSGPWNTAIFGIFLFLLATALLGWNGFARYMAELDGGWSPRVIFSLLTLVVYAGVFAYSRSLIRDGSGWFAWPVVVVAVLTLVVTGLPATLLPGRLSTWCFRAAVNRLIAQRYARVHAMAVREIGELKATEPVHAPPSTGLRRILDGFRTRAASEP